MCLHAQREQKNPPNEIHCYLICLSFQFEFSENFSIQSILSSCRLTIHFQHILIIICIEQKCIIISQCTSISDPIQSSRVSLILSAYIVRFLEWNFTTQPYTFTKHIKAQKFHYVEKKKRRKNRKKSWIKVISSAPPPPPHDGM